MRGILSIGYALILVYNFIFLDDSFNSGKTATKVKHAVLNNGGEIIKTYVFYDGSPIRHDDVVSMNVHSNSTDWNTPIKYAEAIHKMFDPLELDPCSNAGSIINAKTRFLLPQDGLKDVRLKNL